MLAASPKTEVVLVGGSTRHLLEGADHGFHVLKRTGRSDGDVAEELLDRTVDWVEGVFPR